MSSADSSSRLSIDVNADVGESFGSYNMGNDEAVLPLVTSANIACGFHAGDPSVMLRTCELARDCGVRIGAHPGYRDLSGFGRRAMHYTPAELEAEVIYQIGALQAAAKAVGSRVCYVKPHGALYHAISQDKSAALAVFSAMLKVDPHLKLMAQAQLPVLEWARAAGLGTIAEAFADRAYNPDGSLVSRSAPNAVHHDPDVAAAQAIAFATGSGFSAVDGSTLHIQADSLCVHGDNPQALALVAHVRAALTDAGVAVGA
ncbi:MAG: 5-oxoprolinase subunit PxpA [Corynebacterium sp.]|uniref:LamB/YcsF family protein n=1 Tax=Corynebacterium sp. TaxID=1720 RepID=UPI0026DC5F5A|nr:5-oxoprolinase subunit PxpA [Corynebacterium sp.]MDO4760679.1 5-oxoprolinase subunit PxpA [Corynebacterium sp.]